MRNDSTYENSKEIKGQQMRNDSTDENSKEKKRAIDEE